MRMSLNKNLMLSFAIATMMGVPCFAQETAATEPEKAETAVAENVEGQKVTMENETLKIIHQRKSVRNFTDKPVTKEQLETLVKAGMAAPTAINAQPWSFIVVDDPEVKALYAKGNFQEPMINKASALIVVCGEMSIVEEKKIGEYWVQDCSAATENILLAAESLGLGAVWTGTYPKEDRVKVTREVFGIPENVIPLCVIVVGNPEGTDMPKDKYKAERIHWNKY